MSGAAVRTAYRLNVNKTKFYRLAKEKYPEIGPMKAAAFIKYPRSRDYALDFKVGEYYHHLFLSVCGGKRALTELSRELDNNSAWISLTQLKMASCPRSVACSSLWGISGTM